MEKYFTLKVFHWWLKNCFLYRACPTLHTKSFLFNTANGVYRLWLFPQRMMVQYCCQQCGILHVESIQTYWDNMYLQIITVVYLWNKKYSLTMFIYSGEFFKVHSQTINCFRVKKWVTAVLVLNKPCCIYRAVLKVLKLNCMYM